MSEPMTPARLAEIAARAEHFGNVLDFNDDGTGLEFESAEECCQVLTIVNRDIPALLAEVARLKAERAENRTFFDSQNETAALGNLIARACNKPEEPRLIHEYDEMVAAFVAERAGMVPREVAEDCAFLGLCCGSISTTNPYWAPEVVRSAACAENPKNDPGWADAILKDALARAEAEAGKDGG